jgi:dGTPase
VADDIAYDNHDIDDGLRAGLFTLDELLEVPLVERSWKDVLARFPGVEPRRLIPELVRDQIGLMVADVLEETRRHMAEARVERVDDIPAAGRSLAGFSDSLAGEEKALKRFLNARMYNAPAVRAVRDEAQRIVAGLFAAFRDDPDRLPPDRAPADGGEVEKLRAIGDFIAGMTDRYAIRQYRELVGPVQLPEGF